MIAAWRGSLGNDRTKNLNGISMSPIAQLTMKIAYWRPKRHLKPGFTGRGRAGDGVILQVVAPREIILLSVCGVQL
jgi:hypothetical protein